MKTTLDLPHDLIRDVKIRAAQENRRLKDLVAELLRSGLAGRRPGAGGAARRRVRLPLVECAHAAEPDQELTPGKAAEILLELDAAGSVSERQAQDPYGGLPMA